jgi:hypothetical protein
VIILFRACDAGGKAALVRRIGEMLGLKAETRMFHITGPLLACYAVKVVSRVELNAWLGCKNFHGPVRTRFIYIRAGAQLARLPVHDKTVIVTVSFAEGGANAPA